MEAHSNEGKSMKGVIVVFVKTPGISNVKTRLAAGIGPENAILFYSLSVLATESLTRQLQRQIPGMDVLWAVAEPEGLNSEFWREMSTMPQSSGGLGERLANAYESLRKKYSFVCFIGADSPHLRLKDLSRYIYTTEFYASDSAIVGETRDGGFYFFGSGVPLPSDVWTGVTYSTDQTSNQLKAGLSKYCTVRLVDTNFDVDEKQDLITYQSNGFEVRELLPAQVELVNWVRSLKL